MLRFSRQDQELADTNSGDYVNLYGALQRHNKHAVTFLRNFTPTLAQTPELLGLIKTAQQLMEQKFIFRRPRRQPEEWIETLNDPEFWPEFLDDLNRYRGNVSFSSFLLYYDKSNSAIKTKTQPDGKPYLGKYYQLVHAFSRHLDLYLQAANLTVLPENLQQSVIGVVKSYFYSKAPSIIRLRLATKFPDDFTFIEEIPSLRALEVIPRYITIEEEAYLAELLATIEEKLETVTSAKVVDTSGLPDYIQMLANHPLLTREQEVALAKAIERGKEAANILEGNEHIVNRNSLQETVQAGTKAHELFVRSNQRLVLKEALKHYELPLPDLFQAGNIGLLLAITKFDWRRGNRFSTYATRWIRQTIDRTIKDQVRTIRLSHHIQDQIRILKSTAQQLTQILGRNPTDAELAEELNITPQKVLRLFQASQQPASLDQPLLEGEEITLAEVIEDSNSPLPEEIVVRKILNEKIQTCLDQGIISKRQERMLRLRFGLIDGETWTYEQIGEEFGLTRERVRQLINDALENIRSSEFAEDMEDFLD